MIPTREKEALEEVKEKQEQKRHKNDVVSKVVKEFVHIGDNIATELHMGMNN